MFEYQPISLDIIWHNFVHKNTNHQMFKPRTFHLQTHSLVQLLQLIQPLTIYCTKLLEGISILENRRVLSMIWNSSGGWGILPVSSLDHSGMLFREISNAPDETICPSIMLAKKNIIMHAYSLFSRHQLHQDGCGLFSHANMFTPLKMHIIRIILPKP